MRDTCQATNEGLLDRGKIRSVRICFRQSPSKQLACRSTSTVLRIYQDETNWPFNYRALLRSTCCDKRSKAGFSRCVGLFGCLLLTSTVRALGVHVHAWE
jgi:hypothetical protein